MSNFFGNWDIELFIHFTLVPNISPYKESALKRALDPMHTSLRQHFFTNKISELSEVRRQSPNRISYSANEVKNSK